MNNILNKNSQSKKNKKKLIILFASILIFAGVAVVVYPYVISTIFNYRQQNLINTWMINNSAISGQSNKETEEIPITTVSQANQISHEEILDDEIFEEDINAFFDFNYALNAMIGVIKIPSINLAQAVLVGDTKANLNIGICEVRQSGALGQPGNYILAGHYSKVYGRHFNRLPEVQPGASVFISSFANSYEYIVEEILHVKAEDTWAVQINVTESMATLITCDYSTGEPYGRIVVKCKLKP